MNNSSTVKIGRVKKLHLFKAAKTKRTVKKINSKYIKLGIFLVLSFLTFQGIKLSNVDLKPASTFAEVEHESLQFDSVTIENQNNNVLGEQTSQRIYSNGTMVDKRAYILDLYFKENNSPLYGYGQVFVDACDKYGAPRDCISVVAIARNETNLCKYHISAQMHNCWGFGGGGEYRWTFENFNQSIDYVTDTLVNRYGIKYMQNPSLMEGTFCGPDPECSNWGAKIKHFMQEIDDFSAGTGLGRLTES